jgi:AraC family transcriptional regulator, alkane utilization regulator
MPDAGLNDTLSLILDDIRLHGAVFRESHLTAPWALRLDTPGLTSFHVVTIGSVWLLRQGTDAVQLRAGDIAILPGGVAHDVRDAPDSTEPPHELMPELDRQQVEPLRIGGRGAQTRLLSGHFRFDVNLARPLIAALPPLIHLHSTGAPPAWLRIGLQFIAEEVSKPHPGQQVILNRAADILLVEALRDYLESLPEGAGNWLLALRDQSLSGALAAMHRNPERDWSVPDLAELAHLSRSAFADRFTQVVGKPPLGYLTDHRMRLAAWKLAHSNLPIARIAEQVGYASETAFSQAFKRHHGVPPSRMRRSTS